ncbi:MAG TPA: alpha/beta hydrolase [Kribbellaceae bacterium]
MTTRIVTANGAGLCTETFGDPGDPAVLLLAGATCSMDWWEDEFCERLAAGGRYVIRYDYRDTGESVSYPAGDPSYGFDDLVADAAGLLRALDVTTTNLVGVSLGGAIACKLALAYPGTVASLTLASTSPGMRPASPPASDLPMMAPRLLARFTSPEPAPEPDWSDRAAVTEHLVEGQRLLAGSRGFDADRVRSIAAGVAARTRDPRASTVNHGAIDPGEPYRHRLPEITVPTLVLHGTEDPLFPLGHGEAFTRELEHARLIPLDGTGHAAPPPETWDTVIPELVRHTSDSVQDRRT